MAESGSDPTTSTTGSDTNVSASGMSTTESTSTSTSTSVGPEESSSSTAADTDTTGEADTTTGREDTTTDAESSSSSTGDDSSSSTTDDEPGQECPYGELVPPISVMGSTQGEDSEFASSCGGNGGPDVSYTLTAPADGVYVIDTFGSSYDTILAVYNGACGGPPIACNNDAPTGSPQSQVSVELSEGQTVTVVVDSFSLAGGTFTLNVTYFEGQCPNGDLGNVVPVDYAGSTVTADNTLFGTCGGNLAPDDAFTFTAPEGGLYTFDTLGSDFDTVLYVMDACLGTELACNDNGPIDQTSRVALALAQGEEVTVVVDGADLESGNYEINIDVDLCPDVDLGNTVPQTLTGTTVGLVDQAESPCANDNNAPDIAYTWTAPAAGTYVIDTEGSALDTVLHIYDGATCLGTALACDDQGGSIGNSSLVVLDLEAGQLITIIVDGWNGNAGAYQLNIYAPECGDGIISPGEECDGANLGGSTCASFGLAGGVLACSASCDYDFSGCTSCGDNLVNGVDVWDGVALAATRCENLGFAGGTLDCAGDCNSFDTSECSNSVIAVCSQPGLAINATTPNVSDTITITDMGTIVDVDVFLDIPHTWTGDLDVTLTADDLGLSNILAFDVCSSQNDVWVYFNDEGNVPIGSNCLEPFGWEGNVTPQQPLSVYDGNEVNGSWTLNVVDDVPTVDHGVLDEWCLYITVAP